jgi:hypothetical protein
MNCDLADEDVRLATGGGGDKRPRGNIHLPRRILIVTLSDTL